ncbi:hypothetical protein, partial [Citrobacter youngae]|uniref:hypothetical protein n=1 Tax=Citrobacter youngae TaxID=133448 RepID=UPI003EE28F6C
HYWTNLDSVKAFTGHEDIMTMPSATAIWKDFRCVVKLQRIARQGKAWDRGKQVFECDMRGWANIARRF